MWFDKIEAIFHRNKKSNPLGFTHSAELRLHSPTAWLGSKERRAGGVYYTCVALSPWGQSGVLAEQRVPSHSSPVPGQDTGGQGSLHGLY